MKIHLILILAVFISGQSFAKEFEVHPECALLLTDDKVIAEMDPAELYGDLFKSVQTSGLFADSKYFVDMEPRYHPAETMTHYLYSRPKSFLELKRFVDTHFLPPPQAFNLAEFKKVRASNPADYIRQLWPLLTRKTQRQVPLGSSYIGVGGEYVRPGGRFGEFYYWDAYFTALGLLADGQFATFESMVTVFQRMLLRHGRIFNSNRNYMRGRSQPPFFALMVALWQSHFGAASAAQFLPALKLEYSFWMNGAETLKPGQATARVVKLEGNGVLNRYWNDSATPRSEAYREDVALAERAQRDLGRSPEEVYRDLSAGAESGWDFSTRWFSDPADFATIQTTSLLPVDLNSLLWTLENKIAELSDLTGDGEGAQQFREMAKIRARLISKYNVDPRTGTFGDFNWKTGQISPHKTIAMIAPLFVGLATEAQAKRALGEVEAHFLKAGGVRTTLLDSPEQWDKNGWAPQQWMTYVAASRYGNSALAETIRRRWLHANDVVFGLTGEMKEKYDVENVQQLAGGGEYEPQFGFGWSNGVYQAFMDPRPAMAHLINFPGAKKSQ